MPRWGSGCVLGGGGGSPRAGAHSSALHRTRAKKHFEGALKLYGTNRQGEWGRRRAVVGERGTAPGAGRQVVGCSRDGARDAEGREKGGGERRRRGSAVSSLSGHCRALLLI